MDQGASTRTGVTSLSGGESARTGESSSSGGRSPSTPGHHYHHHHHRHRHRSHHQPHVKNCCEQCCQAFWQEQWDNGNVILFFVWFLWLATGTIFYALYDEYGFERGLYYAVNVAYSIGWCWGYTERDDVSKVFSTLYCLSGVGFVAYLILTFANRILVSKDKWFSAYIRHKEEREYAIETKSQGSFMGFLDGVQSFYDDNYLTINTWVLLLCFITFGWIWSCVAVGWGYADGIYFSISCLSTGGLNSIPDSSSDSMYLITGIFTAIGVVVFGLAVAYLASSILAKYHHDRTDVLMNEPITPDEVKALRDVGVDDGTDKVDKSEFLILMIVRLGVIDMELIEHVYEKFHELEKRSVIRGRTMTISNMIEELGTKSGDSSSESSGASSSTGTSTRSSFIEDEEAGGDGIGRRGGGGGRGGKGDVSESSPLVEKEKRR